MPNKSTAEIRALAQQHGPTVIAELARLATKAENEQTRVAAIEEILDRGYGKATQPITADVSSEGSLKVQFVQRVIVDPKNPDGPRASPQ